ncbi:hypothetical protein [Pseudomonas moorei]|uniref:hypothetical protein n=1 Tax=Pseudomonas moorei TaxID=395599 RepID=UPI00200DB257|nr:hypothetical protein [Pseudomonas moorei]
MAPSPAPCRPNTRPKPCERQLQAAKENISSLVDMNDHLSAELKKNRAWMANLEAETTEQLAEIQSLSLVGDQNKKLRRDLEAAKRQ